MRLLLYIAIAFILWRIIRSFANRSTPRQTSVGGTPRQHERIEPTRGADIDYSRVRDADYRDVDSREVESRPRRDRDDLRDDPDAPRP